MTKPKSNKTKGLGNPALLALASSESGKEVVKSTASVIPFLIKTGVVLGLGYFLYYKFTHRFIALKENSAYPTANITNAQAITKAESIYNAMLGFGASLQIVSSNIAGLNYNGFIKVYNAFGHRQSSIPFSNKMNMVEWFGDQFNESELAQLRFLVPNTF